MANKTQQIRIESILGGHSQTSHFSGQGQDRASLGIDPAFPINDSFSDATSGVPSGLLRPTSAKDISGGIISHPPMWIVSTSKADGYGSIYLYNAIGSVFLINTSQKEITALSDAGEMSNSTGNGSAYYDNYLYLAKNTTIARYGPLDGTPTFNGDYWVTTLGKTQLSDTNYPSDNEIFQELPNHVMHRHSDGKLYFADVVGNMGTIHYISTKKTTVEGDTDNDSTYQKLVFGTNLWPSALESYGDSLAIALMELGSGGSDVGSKRNPARLAFWDTTSQTYNLITLNEFPDNIISAMKNVNGILYLISGNTTSAGLRVSRYIGGFSFEEVAYLPTAQFPLGGAVAVFGNYLVFGSSTRTPERAGCVFSIGLSRPIAPNGLFTPVRVSTQTEGTRVTALAFAEGDKQPAQPVVGWADQSVSGLDFATEDYSSTSTWWSQMFRIGQPFKITKIRLPLAQPVTSGMSVTPKVYVDDGSTAYALKSFGSTTDIGKMNIVRKSGSSSESLVGQNSFWLEVKWAGASLCTVGLPITIEYELIDD